MPCCEPTISTFFDEEVTTISYGPSLQASYGAAPKITVLYWDGAQYVAAGIFTEIALDTYPVTSIQVTHGGASTGIIKIG
jgi:hypothetical protein